MAGTSSLRRLLQVLEMEEEQARMALDSAVAEFGLLDRQLTAALVEQRGGRRLVFACAQSGDLTDRLAGLEQARLAALRAGRLKLRIEEAEILAASRRQEYLAKRVERRQAQTLIEEAEARDALMAGRRNQQALDDWCLNRRHSIEQEAEPDRKGRVERARSAKSAVKKP